MANYKYEDFENLNKQYGLTDKNYSSADLQLAQQNPDFGITLANLKNDWLKATTPQQRTLINDRANQLRQNYGGYTGGKNGAGFYAEDPLDNYNKTAMRNIQNTGEFTYDLEKDPLWEVYKTNHLREGQKQRDNALAQAAGAGNGIVSSTGAYAASQAYNDYAAQASAMIPTLYQQAYNRYMDQFSMERQKLSDVQGQQSVNTTNARYEDERDYARGRDQISDQRYADETAYNRKMAEDETAYNRQRDAVADARYADETAYQRQMTERAYQDTQSQNRMAELRQISAEAKIYTKEYAEAIGHPEWAGLAYPQPGDTNSSGSAPTAYKPKTGVDPEEEPIEYEPPIENPADGKGDYTTKAKAVAAFNTGDRSDDLLKAMWNNDWLTENMMTSLDGEGIKIDKNGNIDRSGNREYQDYIKQRNAEIAARTDNEAKWEADNQNLQYEKQYIHSQAAQDNVYAKEEVANKTNTSGGVLTYNIGDKWYSANELAKRLANGTIIAQTNENGKIEFVLKG